MGHAAGKASTSLEQIAKALERQRQAQEAARQSAFQEVAVLQQKIAIQQQALHSTLSLEQATRKMAEAEIFAKTGSRDLAQQLAAARTEFNNNTAAIQKMGQSARQAATETETVSASVRRIAETAIGFQLANIFSQAVGAVKDLISEGIRYNSVLEQQKTGVASIIAGTNQIVDAQGRTLEGAQAFNAAQQLSSGLMRQIQKDALLTTATTEQLVDAFQQALGPLSAAGFSLDQSREATLRIVQAASALGVPMHQIAQEVRAIAEGSIDVNARFAKAVGIRQQDVVLAKEQGTLFDLIIQKTQAFAAAGEATSRSFSGLTSSLADVSSQLLGRAFAAPFEGLKSGLAVALRGLLDLNAAQAEQAAQAERSAHTLAVLREEEERNSSAIGQLLNAFVSLGAWLGGQFLTGVTLAWEGTVRLFTVLKEIASIAGTGVWGILTAGVTAFFSVFQGKDPLKVFSESLFSMGRAASDSVDRIIAVFRNAQTATNDFALSFVPLQEQVAAATFRAREATDLQGESLLKVNGRLQEYTTRAAGAAGAASAFAEAQTKALHALAEQTQSLAVEATVWETARAQGLSYAKALEQVEIAKNTLKTGSREEAEAHAANAARVKEVTEAYDKDKDAATALATATKQAAEEAKRHAEAIAKATAADQERIVILREQIGIQARVLAGTLAAEEGERQITTLKAEHAAKTEALSSEIGALTTQYEKNEAAIKRNQAAMQAEQQAFAAYLSQVKQARGSIDDAVDAYEQETAALRAQIAIYERVKAGTLDVAGAQRELAISAKEAELKQKNFYDGMFRAGESVRDLATRMVDLTGKTDQLAGGFDQLKKVDFADAIIDNFADVLVGIRQGTRDIEDILSGLGDTFITTFIEMFAETLKQKLKWEFQLSGNLLNDLPRLFSTSGLLSGGGFLNSLFGLLGSAGGQAQGLGAGFGTIFGNSSVDASATIWKSGWPDIFSGLGGQASQGGFQFGSLFGTAALFAFGAKIIASDFSKGKTGTGALDLLGGIFIGKIFGPIFDAFFEHVPTKGTRIRQGVKEYLKEIEASFADEIDTGNYFFEETKKLADQMFGGHKGEDFLKASKIILENEVGPKLAAQLKALGTFITADQALDLGKPIEQTATTFGNLLVHNLGLDRIPAAIAEIVQKGGLSLEGLTDKLKEVFEQGAISEEFYKEAVVGAVDIFTIDLPAAINASAIALKSFTDDGIFSLTEFTTRVQAATDLYKGIAAAAADALTSPLTDGEALAAFDKALDAIEKEILTRKFLTDFEPKLFEGIDLSDGLGADEAELLRQRLVDGRKELQEIFRVAGLLPGQLSDATAQAAAFANILTAAFNNISGATALEKVRNQLQELKDRAREVEKELAETPMEKFGTRFNLKRELRDLKGQIDNFDLGAALGAKLREDIADSLQSGIEEALLNAVINEAVLGPFKEKLAALMKGALADGVLSADELAQIGQLAGQAAADSEAAAKAIAPALKDAEKLAAGVRGNFEVGADALHDIDLTKILRHSQSIFDYAAQARDQIQQVTLVSVVDQAEAIRRALEAGAAAINNASLPTEQRRLAAGGRVGGAGTGDVIPAMLDPREFIVNPRATQKHLALLQYLNSGGEFRHMAEGGTFENNDALSERLRDFFRGFLNLKVPDSSSKIGAIVEAIKKLQAFIANPPKGRSLFEQETITLALKEAQKQLVALSKELQSRIAAILDPIKAFIGETEDPVQRVKDQFETLRKSLLDNRKDLEAAGVDVDKYLAQLASALPEKIKEAVEAANRATIESIKSIEDAKKQILGTGNAGQNDAQRAAEIARLQKEFATAKGDKKADIGRELARLLSEQVSQSRLDKFGQDFADLRKRNLKILDDIQKALQKQLDDAFKEANKKKPPPEDKKKPPPKDDKKPPPEQEKGALNFTLNFSIPITPGMKLDGKTLLAVINKEAGREFESAVDTTINSGTPRQSILRLLRPR